MEQKHVTYGWKVVRSAHFTVTLDMTSLTNHQMLISVVRQVDGCLMKKYQIAQVSVNTLCNVKVWAASMENALWQRWYGV